MEGVTDLSCVSDVVTLAVALAEGDSVTDWLKLIDVERSAVSDFEMVMPKDTVPTSVSVNPVIVAEGEAEWDPLPVSVAS